MLSSLVLLAMITSPLAFSGLPINPSGVTAAEESRVSNWRAKVDSWVLDSAGEGQAEYLLFLSEQADLSEARTLKTRQEKGAYVFERLRDTAKRNQAALRAELERRGVEHRPFWIANMIWVRSDAATLEALARRSDVARVYANPSVRYEAPEVSAEALAPQEATAVEWNIRHVGADQVWAAWYSGQGVVVGGQDTGYAWQHPALINQYRGWNGAAADHNYSWHDAIHEDNPNSLAPNTCGLDVPQPCDDGFHGTHTMGTIVGDDGAGMQIGMAPGARWIGCRNMEEGWGTPATYAECYQWFLAPTDLNDKNPRPDLAPDIVNNSWACPPQEGCTDPGMLLAVVQNVRAAGILTVHSAGNSGPTCESINTPAAIYDESFTVGNTTSSDSIAFNSSRGPVTVDGSNRLKPDISAPGTFIRSSVPPAGYNVLSGTSMAAPHVAGLAALLISAQPALAGQVDRLEAEMQSSAIPLTTSETCGGDLPGAAPNNVYGYGRIDAPNTVLDLLAPRLSVSKTAPETIFPGENITYTLTVTNTHPLFSVHNLAISDTLPAEASFITATLPHQFDGGTIRWTAPELSAGSNTAFQLIVGTPVTITDRVENSNYLADSEETPPVGGPPVYTDITPLPGVTISSGSQLTVKPGSVITSVLSVKNTGENGNNFIVTLESSQGWASVDQEEITVLPGEIVELVLVIHAPLNAPDGTLEESKVLVRSADDPAVFAKSVTRTMVPYRFFYPFLVFTP